MALFPFLPMKQLTAAILVVLLAIQTTGCMVGYTTTTTSLSGPGFARQPLPDINVAYPLDPTSRFRIAFDRVLRGRYEILGMRQTKEFPQDLFTISVTHKVEDTSNLSNGLFLASYFSFSVIPGVLTEIHRITIEITSPDGYRKAVDYVETTRTYNWLPFFLFSPDYVFLIMPAGEKGHEEEEFRSAEEIADHFMREVSPFILAHSGSVQPGDRR